MVCWVLCKIISLRAGEKGLVNGKTLVNSSKYDFMGTEVARQTFFQRLIEVFKMAKGWSAIPLESMFELSTTKHLRGHNLKLVKHRSDLELRRNCFTERLINRWNSFDQQSLDVDSVNCFKNHLQRLSNTRMGFFVDQSPVNPLAAQVLTGVATPGK